MSNFFDKEKIKDTGYWFSFLKLHVGILFYSFSMMFMKLASSTEFFSGDFFLFYVYALLMLVIYAILWQMALKDLSLSTAYANKSIAIVWGILFGAVVFKEQLTLKFIIGAAIVLIGVILVVNSDE